MTSQEWYNGQIKGITYKMLGGFISVILSIVLSAISITSKINEYKEGVRADINKSAEKINQNVGIIYTNSGRITELEAVTRKHETEIQILKTR